MKDLDTPGIEFKAKADALSLLADFAKKNPNKPALIQGDRTVSWRDMGSHVARVSNALIGMGIGKGDRVALLSRNSIEYSEAFMGILGAGACAVPLPSLASGEALDLMLKDSATKILILSRAYLETIQEIETGLSVEAKIAFDFDSQGWISYDSWIHEADDTFPAVPLGAKDEFNLIYSSGTTGTPKGILHNHATRSSMYMGMRAFGFDDKNINLVSTPIYSNTTITTWLPCLCAGGTNVIMAKFDARESLELIQRHKVTHAMFVPVQYDRIMRLKNYMQYDLSSMKFKFCTSAPFRAELKKQVVDRFPGELIEIYGMTEGGVTTMLFANHVPEKLDSVGKVVGGGEIKIIGQDGKELPPGSTGEIVGRHPNMMSGYLNRENETNKMLWRDAAGNLFFKSGDVGRLDEEGFLYLSDRKKDVIISGGLNIFATDLELVLLKHEAVHEAAVIGIPSQDWGETPLALVILEKGASVKPEFLCEWANAKLGKSQKISKIELRENLPKNEIGKTLKRELREPYWKDQKTNI